MSAHTAVDRFPSLSGESLTFAKLNVPEDLTGELNLVFVPFLMRHQHDVDRWLEELGDIEDRHEGLAVYELPLMRRFPVFYRRWIDDGMRSGIPDPATRDRTITVYTDRDAFLCQVGLDGVDAIYVVLLDSRGRILWSHIGAVSNDALTDLRSAVSQAAS